MDTGAIGKDGPNCTWIWGVWTEGKELTTDPDNTHPSQPLWKKTNKRARTNKGSTGRIRREKVEPLGGDTAAKAQPAKRYRNKHPWLGTESKAGGDHIGEGEALNPPQANGSLF